MADESPQDVTLNTLHEDLRAGFADLKTVMLRNLPTREQSQEMIRLLRENNRLQEERFVQLDARIRENHLQIQQTLGALAEGQRALHEDLRALIALLRTLIERRGDGQP